MVCRRYSAASERWAFAFSAKRDWRSKVRSDVKEIVCTGRATGASISSPINMCPRVKVQQVQDALTKEYGVPVTIMDRTWILELRIRTWQP